MNFTDLFKLFGGDVNDPKHWNRFYRKYYGIQVDCSQFPMLNEGGDSSLFMPKEFTLEIALKTFFMVSKMSHMRRLAFEDPELLRSMFTGLLRSPMAHDREPSKGSYAIRFHRLTEQDNGPILLSANELEEQKIKCLTLLELLVYDMKHFSETGEHLGFLLAAGSRAYDTVPALFVCEECILLHFFRTSSTREGLRVVKVA